MFKLIHLRNVSVPSLLAIALGGCVAYGGEIVDPYPHPYPARSLNMATCRLPVSAGSGFLTVRRGSNLLRATATTWSGVFHRAGSWCVAEA